MSLVVLPVLLPFVTAIVLALAPPQSALQRGLSLASGLALLCVQAALAWQLTADPRPLTIALGAWPAEVGIIWVVDGLCSLMLLLTAIISLAALLASSHTLQSPRQGRFYFILHQFLLVGVNGSFVTADLFNLFVFFEVMLLTSFVQMSLAAKPETMHRILPYVLVNLAASMLFLLGVGFVYAGAGTTNMAILSLVCGEQALTPVLEVGLALILLVLALKAALAPIFFWLPDSYPEAPLVVSALFAGLLTKVGVYALYRLVPLLSTGGDTLLPQILLPLAILSMVAGVLGALGSSSVRAILAFHIISQVGYMALGLALYTIPAITAGIVYIGHHMLVKTALFLAGGAAEQLRGSVYHDQGKGSLLRSHPLLCSTFFVAAMALVGVPPLSGFWGKLLLLKAALAVDAWMSVFIALMVSFLTLASMLKIWDGVFCAQNTSPNAGKHAHMGRGLQVGTLGLVSLSLILGLSIAPLYERAAMIASQLLNPAIYIEAVLKAVPGKQSSNIGKQLSLSRGQRRP